MPVTSFCRLPSTVVWRTHPCAQQPSRILVHSPTAAAGRAHHNVALVPVRLAQDEVVQRRQPHLVHCADSFSPWLQCPGGVGTLCLAACFEHTLSSGLGCGCRTRPNATELAVAGRPERGFHDPHLRRGGAARRRAHPLRRQALQPGRPRLERQPVDVRAVRPLAEEARLAAHGLALRREQGPVWRAR